MITKTLKKAALLALVSSIAAISFACAPKEVAAPAAEPTAASVEQTQEVAESEQGASFEGQPIVGYTPGTYQGESKGNNGLVKVEVVLDAEKIVSVKVVEHEETPGISDPALESVPKAIVDGQTLKVDTVSGATYTSNAIIEAVAGAIESAGGDVASLRK